MNIQFFFKFGCAGFSLEHFSQFYINLVKKRKIISGHSPERDSNLGPPVCLYLNLKHGKLELRILLTKKIVAEIKIRKIKVIRT